MNVERQFNGFVKYIDSTHYAYILPEGEDFGSYPQTKVEYFKKYGFKITLALFFNVLMKEGINNTITILI